MYVYADLVMLINFGIDFLLLWAANRLSGYAAHWRRIFLSAAIGGIYGGFCIIPEFQFLGNLFWRIIFLFLLGSVAFGWNKSALRRCMLFVLLSMALGGLAIGIGNGGMRSIIGSTLCIFILCGIGFQGNTYGNKYIPVELNFKGKTIKMIALKDTGNNLRDPVTGEQVLIVGAKIAEKIAGLNPIQLKHPIETIMHAQSPGLRLIPYRAVGQSGSMLLGMRCERAIIGSHKGSTLVAFAPEGLGEQEEFQALAGGMI